jgi:hypothetical protein
MLDASGMDTLTVSETDILHGIIFDYFATAAA